MNTITIRPAAPADAEIIVRYNAAIASETEHLSLDLTRLKAGVEAVLNDPSKGFYIVAESGGRIVGQLMVTYEWSDWRNGVFWWIQSVYVDPEFRKQGVFTTLYRHIEHQAHRDGSVCGIRLYVERENKRAQATYKKMGMDETVYQLYETDFVMKRH
jgi:ribosomal protein S18 acetylase RimI-like enzyme